MALRLDRDLFPVRHNSHYPCHPLSPSLPQGNHLHRPTSYNRTFCDSFSHPMSSIFISCCLVPHDPRRSCFAFYIFYNAFYSPPRQQGSYKKSLTVCICARMNADGHLEPGTQLKRACVSYISVDCPRSESYSDTVSESFTWRLLPCSWSHPTAMNPPDDSVGFQPQPQSSGLLLTFYHATSEIHMRSVLIINPLRVWLPLRKRRTG